MKNQKLDTIEKGDLVDVFCLNRDGLFNVRVLSVPCDVGDYWKMRKEDDQIIYLQIFDRIELRAKGET